LTAQLAALAKVAGAGNVDQVLKQMRQIVPSFRCGNDGRSATEAPSAERPSLVEGPSLVEAPPLVMPVEPAPRYSVATGRGMLR
jgi:hypothetical protein